jgi:hypothetical protein
MSIINHKGYIASKTNIDSQLLNSIRNELTVRPNINPNYAEQVAPYPVYFETDKNIYLPRFYGLQKLGFPSKGVVFQPLICPLLETTMSLRDYQIPIITKTLDILNNGCGGGILELYTGSGKTSIALYLMCQLKVKTLIIVHKSFLLQQWIERIKQFIPNASIGIIQGQIFDVIPHAIGSHGGVKLSPVKTKPASAQKNANLIKKVLLNYTFSLSFIYKEHKHSDLAYGHSNQWE